MLVKKPRRFGKVCDRVSYHQNIQERALRKLRQLDVSANLEDLRIPPAHHIEALVGDRVGHIQYPHYEAVATVFCLA